MPHLACRTCGRRIYSVAPLSSMTADELRCPRCGAYFQEDRRDPSAGRPSGARTRPTTRGRPRPTAEGDAKPTEGATGDGTERRGTDRRTRPAPRWPSRRRPAAARRSGRLEGLTDRSAHCRAAAAAILADMQIAFLGFGLIGGSIARAVRANPETKDWTMAAWSPSGEGPRKAAADRRHRCRRGEGRGRPA